VDESAVAIATMRRRFAGEAGVTFESGLGASEGRTDFASARDE
jgi:hypothetical protein